MEPLIAKELADVLGEIVFQRRGFRRDLGDGFERADERRREPLVASERHLALQLGAMLAGAAALAAVIVGALIALR